jgi:hypothetical protein
MGVFGATTYWSTDKHDWLLVESDRPIYVGSSSP